MTRPVDGTPSTSSVSTAYRAARGASGSDDDHAVQVTSADRSSLAVIEPRPSKRASQVATMSSAVRQRCPDFTMRERQIIEALYRRGSATAREVMSELPRHSAYSTVRTQLRVLERKGHVRHYERGLLYVYEPVVARANAARLALQRVIDTFFGGSASAAIESLAKRRPTLAKSIRSQREPRRYA